MISPNPAQPRVRSETEQGLDDLAARHAAMPFILTGLKDQRRFAHLDGDPVALTDELLRLARIGAALEAIEEDYGRKPLTDALQLAARTA